jgi:DNA repair exonuclease SbcCD ATPase subunit
MIKSFLPVFQERVDKLKKSLKEELALAKSERRKEVIKSQVKEAKRLQKAIKEAAGDSNTCPHCGGIL